MNRYSVLRSLYEFEPDNESKRKILNRFISFIKSNNDCFNRNIKGHITGSAWLTDDKDRVLLTHHKKLNKWLQLGGHCDGNPNVPQVAKREAIEESGIYKLQFKSDRIFDIDIHCIPEHKKEPSHFHYDIRFHLETKISDVIISNESNQLRWFKKNELISGLIKVDQSIKNMINIWDSQ